MRVTVLGGTGFIGSHLVDALLAAEHTVRVLSRRPERYRPPLPRVEYRFGQFEDSLAVGEAITGAELVYHLVSTSVPSTSNLDPAADVQGNLVPTVRLLDQMVRLGQRRIVFMSSGGTVYGPPQVLPVPESHPLAPRCSHGVVKVAVEHYLGLYAALYGLEPVVIRAGNAFGPRQGHLGIQGAVATFLAQVRRREPVQVFGNGRVVRDYVYVEDLARLLVLAGTSERTGTFNAGSGIGTSLLEVLERIRTELDFEPQVRFLPARSFDVPAIVLDSRRAAEAFGWKSTTSFPEGLRKHWEWLGGLPGSLPFRE